MSTKIQWTNETWNPIIGCSKISEGCKECYAEKMAIRLASMGSTDYYLSVTAMRAHVPPLGWNGRTSFIEHQLEKPSKRKKPTMYFVCSMGDLFHESVPFEWVDKVIDVIVQNPRHTFQILTKRPVRMRTYFKGLYYRYKSFDGNKTIKNLWLGVTSENQEQANKRIPILLETPAVKRFVSCEPLLSNIDFYQNHNNLFKGVVNEIVNGKEQLEFYGETIDWVIAGPETGHNSRPMQKEWIENIYNQCKTANVSFFDKKNTLGLNLTQIPK